MKVSVHRVKVIYKIQNKLLFQKIFGYFTGL